MQDVESYGVVSNDTKSKMLKQRIVAYLAIVLTLVSFIFSCVGLNMGRQKNLEKTLYTFSFPYFNQIPKVETGMVVSLDTKGYVFTGAGTTISLNVTVADEFPEAKNDIRVCAFTNNVIFAGSTGALKAYEISYDDIAIDNNYLRLPRVGGEERQVEALYKIDANTLVVAGSGELLPITVTVTEVSSTNYKVDYVVGTPYSYTKVTKSYSYCDTLPNWEHMENTKMMACSWEEGMSLYTVIATMSGEGKEKTFHENDKQEYGATRQFHGLAGCGLNGYILAAVGPMRNESEHVSHGHVYVKYAFIDSNNHLHFSREKTLPYDWSVGFFTIDNVGPKGAVMCYTRAASGGINCMNMDVEHGPRGGVQFGSRVMVNTGGAAIDLMKTKMQVINRKTFAVMWADKNVGGSISYQMVTFNNAGDMHRNGPAYVIRQRGRGIKTHIVGCSGVDDYKSFIVELVRDSLSSKAFLHTVYVYPRPIGIAAKSFAGGNQVQFGGLWKVSKKALARIRDGKLRVGRMYYTNDRGQIIEGLPVGYAHRSFGFNYIISRSDESMVSLSNQVGMAINEKELLLKFF